jgi:hypothetical protein
LINGNDDRLVDASFDVDGDGTVSQRDYYIAKQFDLDRDGKLNESEAKVIHSTHSICAINHV